MTLAHSLGARLASARLALGDRQMARLLFTWGAWVTTDWAFLITVSVMALDAGGPAAVGLVGAVRVLPAAVLSGVVTGVADRLPRPLVLAGVNVAWCLLALVMAWCAVVDAPLLTLLVAIGLGSAASTLLKPCLQALVPQLVQSPSQLIVANSAYSTIEGLGTIVGPALCGVLLASTNESVVFVVLAAVYAAAAVAGGLIKTPFQPAQRAANRPGSAWLAPLEGLRLLIAPGTRTLFWLFMMQTCMRGFLNVFVILVATSGSGGSDAAAGSLFAAVGVGGLVGAVAAVSLGSRLSVLWISIGLMLWGVPVVVIGIWSDPTVAWLALAALGLGNAILDVHGYSMLNRLVPDHLAGRAWGAFHGGSAAAVALGSLGAPALVAAVGLSWAMVIAGSVMALAPIVVSSRLLAVHRLAGARPSDVDLFRELTLFAPLSLIAIERLARAAHERRFEAGAVVVRQAEVGDAFYVVAEGELAVWQDSREVRRLGPRDTFGEIALLQSVPRTASVIAETPSRLLSLDGDSFVAAVTGHRMTDNLVRGTVDRFLTEDAGRDRTPGSPAASHAPPEPPPPPERRRDTSQQHEPPA
ncbi:MAG: cyclic nucleotide-binding domain-containing protein [Propionibacteriaceae bacterium]